MRERVDVPARGPPEQLDQVVLLASATCRTVVMPAARSFRDVTGPTPQRRSTGRGWRKASSPSGGTTSSPSGFATALATFARNFVRGHADRDRQADLAPDRRAAGGRAISSGVPNTASIPRASRNASSIERGSTTGDVSLEDLEDRPAGLRVRGHPRPDDDRVGAAPARLEPPMPPCTPWALAS